MFRVVKLSSPNLNYLIIAGAALLYIAVILHAVSAQNEQQITLQTALCNVIAVAILYYYCKVTSTPHLHVYLYRFGSWCSLLATLYALL